MTTAGFTVLAISTQAGACVIATGALPAARSDQIAPSRLKPKRGTTPTTVSTVASATAGQANRAKRFGIFMAVCPPERHPMTSAVPTP